jgi:hypothetical protein
MAQQVERRWIIKACSCIKSMQQNNQIIVIAVKRQLCTFNRKEVEESIGRGEEIKY